MLTIDEMHDILNNLENTVNRVVIENTQPTDALYTYNRTTSNVLNDAYTQSISSHEILKNLLDLLNTHNTHETKIGINYAKNITRLSELYSTPTFEYKQIHVCYIPKNANQIELPEGIIRHTILERFLIQNQRHFIRICYAPTNEIFILTNQISCSLIWQIIFQIPNLLQLQATNENPKLQTILKIFELLFEIYNSTESSIKTQKLQELNDIATNLHNILDYINKNLEKFKENFQEIITKGEKKETEHLLDQIKQNINDTEERLRNLYIAKKEQSLKLIAYNTLQIENILDFFTILENKLEVIKAEPNAITVKIVTPLKYFDSTDFLQYENNPTSTLQQLFNEQEIKALHEIFVTRKFQILIQSNIRISINNTIEPITFNNGTRTYQSDALYNPHIKYYDCWREYKNELRKAVINHNFEAIVPLLINATASINVAETQTFVSHFLYDLKDFSEKIKIIDENNNMYNWEDYLKLIGEQNNAEN